MYGEELAPRSISNVEAPPLFGCS